MQSLDKGNDQIKKKNQKKQQKNEEEKKLIQEKKDEFLKIAYLKKENEKPYYAFHNPIEIILNERKKELTENDKIEENRITIKELKDPQIIVLDYKKQLKGQNDQKENLISQDKSRIQNQYEETNNSSIMNNNINQNFDEKIQENYRKPQSSDGLLYYYSQLNKMMDSGIKMLICVTVYNEELQQLEETLDGIYENLQFFFESGVYSDNIAVCVIYDGIDKMHKSMENWFDSLEKQYEVSVDKKLKERKQHFEKSIQRNLRVGQLKRNKKEQKLIKEIDQLQKKVNEEKMKNQSEIVYQWQRLEDQIQKYYESTIKDLINKWFKDKCIKDEKTCPIDNREQYIEKRIVQLKEDLIRLIHEKNENFKQNLDEEFVKYPTNSCYLYSLQYLPQKYINKLKELEQSNKQNDDKEIPEYKLNVFLSVKLKNGGKLSSHMWFFRGFCEMFNPKYCVLIDAGTVPLSDALFKFFKSMECDSRIGGVCGYMGLKCENIMDPNTKKRKDQDYYSKYDFFTKVMINLFDVQKAQKFEYAISHMLDKSMESLFGFIQVLPGAFSAYRWNALKKIKDVSINDNILDKEYLISALDPEFQSSPDYNVKKANMFLAEDRILCLEILSRKQNNFILKYLSDAQCYTDPPNSFIQLMKQRRRWINGSWFALDYVIRNFQKKIKDSQHSFGRKILIFIIMAINLTNMYIQYFSLALYFIFLNMFCKNILKQFYWPFIGEEANLYVLSMFIYALGIGCLFFLSMLQKQPEKRVYPYTFISTAFGIFMIISFVFYVILIVLAFQYSSSDIAVNDNYAIPAIQQCNNPLIVKERYQNQIQLCQMTLQVGKQMPYLIICNGKLIIPFILQIIKVLAYLIPLLFYFDRIIFDVLLNLPHYLYFSPSYIHTLLIFAFCNVHDMSWGTKGADQDSQIKEVQNRFQKDRITFLGKYILTNIILILVFSIANASYQVQTYFVLVCAWFFTGTILIKGICSTFYNLIYQIQKRSYQKIIQVIIIIKIFKYQKGQKQSYIEESINIKETFNMIYEQSQYNGKQIY